MTPSQMLISADSHVVEAPHRIIGIGLMSAYGIESAIRELERCHKMGMRGAMIWQCPHPDIPFSSGHYDPFWARAQDSDCRSTSTPAQVTANPGAASLSAAPSGRAWSVTVPGTTASWTSATASSTSSSPACWSGSPARHLLQRRRRRVAAGPRPALGDGVALPTSGSP